MSQSIKPFSFSEYKSIYSRVPRITVEIVIVKDKKVLLTKRAIIPHNNQWHLPGGTVYFKERLEDACLRVAKDELGIEITVGKQIGIIEYLHEEDFGGFDHPIGIAFLCQTAAENFLLDDSATEIAYFASLPDSLVEEQKDFLKKFM